MLITVHTGAATERPPSTRWKWEKWPDRPRRGVHSRGSSRMGRIWLTAAISWAKLRRENIMSSGLIHIAARQSDLPTRRGAPGSR